VIPNLTFSPLQRADFNGSLDDRKKVLSELEMNLESGKIIITMQGNFHLTKTQVQFSEAYLLHDHQLEQSVKWWLNERISFEKIIAQYHSYDAHLMWQDWPRHYAMRVLAGSGPIACGSNIFAFFPEALGIRPRTPTDVFGMEFIDIWNNIFQQSIFPCVHEGFDHQSQLEVTSILSYHLDQAIYLAAVFHEIGHRAGPWKVSPVSHPQLKLSRFHWGVVGEIATDSLLVAHLSDFPEIAYFVTLQRLFWFGRRGYRENPISGLTNEDNDGWLGSYLWEKLRATGAIARNELNHKWKINGEKLVETYQNITTEIDKLGAECLNLERPQQELIDNWMRSKVEWKPAIGFIVSDELRELFERCSLIPEVPHFSTAMSLADMRSLGEEFNRELT